jgi:serine/threonine protein kinase
MRDDTIVTGLGGSGDRGVAGWSVPGYTELKALGSGGSGDVVLARHDASGTLVAIKYLRRKFLADPQWAGLFRAEAQVLGALNDPNIVRLYEYVESPSGAAIVMELVDGVSVREILTHHGATTPEAALVVLRGSLRGLAAAHRHNVVHRDYKPENVLVNGNGESKLTDFGIAARTGAEAVAAGSLMYAPPEQFAGAPASPAGDVYAATATFYECLTGRPPFTGDTAERLLYQHLAEPVPLDPVPEPLRPLITAGMAKVPENRPADAATFIIALNDVASRVYGPDWAKRGRSHLGEAALLLLAALWPSGTPAAVHGSAVHGSAVERVNLSPHAQESRESRHLWHLRHLRHLLHLRDRRALRYSPVKAAVATTAAVAVVAAGAALTVGLTRHHNAPPPLTLPAVIGVSPDGGTDLGGTTVTITGTGLNHATLVTFGGVAGRIIAKSDTQITVASPPSTGTASITVTTAAITTDSGTRITGTGTVDIIVMTPTGASRLTAADHYTFAAPQPAVTGVSPDSGGTTGGTTVSITGTGLAGATAVRFGGAAGRITADSNTQITVTSPPGTGTVPVTVTTQAGTSQTTAVGHYTYTARPKQTQSISLTAPAPATAGSSAPLSAGSGGSGNPVVFSVDRASGPGVCVISGRTVTYTIAGPCVIDANQAGNGTYAAAPQAQQMITVTGKPQSISFTAPASATAGGSATLSANGGGSGNPVMFSVDRASGPGVCAVSGRTVTYTAAGSCVIDANQAGNGTYAAAVQVQQTITVASGHKQTQTITFTAPASGTVGDNPVTLSATASSGLTVTLTVDRSGAGVCTVSGFTVTYYAAGSCVIDANQAGNATWAAAVQVQQRITVASGHKQTQTITFTAPASGMVGDDPVTLSATASSGLTVTLTADPASAGVCTLSGSTVTYTTAGSCVIDANQAGDTTYAPAQAQHTITVSRQTQSITITAPGSGTVDGSAPVSATASSGLPVTLIVDPGSAAVCTLSSSTVTYTAAGNCVLDANQAGDTTYAPAQAQHTITVASPTKQTQSITITAPSSGIVDGDGAPVSATASSGLPVTLIVDPGSAGVCTLSGGFVSYAAAGNCVLDANQAGDATYAPAQAQHTITVRQSQSITITASSSGTVGGSASASATASSGLPVTLIVDPGSAAVCTLSGGFVSYAAAGNCVLDANQAGDATYAPAQAQQTITVTAPTPPPPSTPPPIS